MRHELLINESDFDRIVRVAIGLGAFLIVGTDTVWGYLGFLLLMSGLAGYCPLYHLLGVTTCSAATPTK